MFTHLLSDAVKFLRSANATVAGTTAINGAAVDLQTQDSTSVLFIAALGALTSTQVTSLKAQYSDDNTNWYDFTTPASVTTSAAADADGNKLLVLDVHKPQHRYVRPVLNRGTANAVLDALIAIPYNARTLPTTFSSTYVSQSAKSIEAA